MIKEKYKAAFIIPMGSKKILEEEGWAFQGGGYLSVDIIDFLIGALQLKFLERYLGMEDYIGENIKMSVVYDEQKKIEMIYFQLRGDAMAILANIFITSSMAKQAELFIPSLAELGS